jgi:pimeloyl-ACP methyl ester carboxylesterase
LPAYCSDSDRSSEPAPDGEAVAERWADRTISWSQQGASFDEIQQAFRSVEEEDLFRTDKGSWTYELRAVGCEHEAIAIELELAGDTDGALVEYGKAAKFYEIARFPALVTPEREAIYSRMLELYEHANLLSGNPPIERVAFQYSGESIEGFFQTPAGVEDPALIIMTGGLDTWRTSYERYLKTFWEAGFATFIFDMPGTGFNPVVLDPEGDKMYGAAIEHFKDHDGINGEKIGVYTISFSGSIGVELALSDQNVGAVVDNCGGAHHVFASQPQIILTPGIADSLLPLQQAILWTIGFRKNMQDHQDEALDVWANTFPTLSLVNQGLLPVDPGSEQQAPLLHIHGEDDELMTMDDFDLVGEMGVVREVLLYPDDGHCSPLNFDDHQPKAVQFFIEHLEYDREPTG